MHTTFLSNAPHPAHGLWADSINAHYIDDRVKEYKVKNLSRLYQTFKTVKKIPSHTDFVLCESASQLFTGVLWKVNNPRKKLGLIVSDPKYYHMWKMTSVKKNFYFWTLKKVDVFICSSHLMKSYLPKACQPRAFVVPPAFTNKDFTKVKANLNAQNIIFTARICLEKGVNRLVDVFTTIKKTFPKSKLFLLGASSYIPGQGNLREQLEKRNLKDVYFPGHIDIRPYQKKSSIYVNLAWIEPASVSVLQSMSVGIVPIVNQSVGNKTYVAMIAPELVVNTDQEAEAMITKLWKNKKLLKKYSKKAIQISKKYPNEKESVKLFQQALKTRFNA